MDPIALFAALLMLPISQQPAPPTPQPPTVDQLIDRLVETRKQLTALQKTEAAQVAELKARLKELQDKLAQLGVTPVPPDPAPPPKPVDPLAQKVRDAYAADKGTRDDALQLAALYRQAATLTGDAGVPSSAELLRRVQEASKAVLADPDLLLGVRTVVAGELLTALGMSSDAPLTAAQRKGAVDLFTRLAAILEGF